jgi:hypothetical protein
MNTWKGAPWVSTKRQRRSLDDLCRRYGAFPLAAVNFPKVGGHDADLPGRLS